MSDQSPHGSPSVRVDHDVEGDVIVAGGNITIERHGILETMISREERLDLRNRSVLLDKVHKFWIDGVLHESLHGMALMELGVKDEPNAVEYPWEMLLRSSNQEPQALPSSIWITDIFETMGHALLILGEPGSGKTTLMLEIARDMIDRARKDPAGPIPVVLSLSSWSVQRRPIVEWLIDELNAKYLVPHAIARKWMDEQSLLLLLDNLDEVRTEYRDDCVRAINQFRLDHGLTPIAVCSRVSEYELLPIELKMEGAVLLQPMSDEQIDRYLTRAGLDSLRASLSADPVLRDLAHSPLLLSIMMLVYKDRDSSTAKLPAAESVETQRKHLIDSFVDLMFRNRGREERFSRNEVLRHLGWLASQMNSHGQTIFLIERLQPSWLQTTSQLLLYVAATRLAVGLLVGIVLAVALSGSLGGAGRLIGGGIGLLVGVISGLAALFTLRSSVLNEIRPAEALRWSWPAALLGLCGGTLAGAIARIVAGLLLNFSLFSPFSVGLALLIGLYMGVIFGLTGREVPTSSRPNEGIRQSAYNALKILAALLLTSVLSLGLFLLVKGVFESSEPFSILLLVLLVFGSLIGLVGGLIFGGYACVQHLVLRLLLRLHGHMPRHLGEFLDYASSLIFLRKVGGGYIFVNRILMDHLREESTDLHGHAVDAV